MASTLAIAQSNDVTWQEALRGAIRSQVELLTALQLTESEDTAAAREQFSIRVPRDYLRRMVPGDPNDPLLLQVLASADEMVVTEGFSPDPLEELTSNPISGLVHKYADRALIMPTAACAVHCRYCFRRHFPYQDNRLDETALTRIIDYLASHQELNEIILSGGDPLVVEDDYLGLLIDRLATIPHLKRIRVHSRVPVVIPQRLTESLATVLSGTRLEPVLVIHCNHPQELDPPTQWQFKNWSHYGIPTLNQSVLLQGINDDVEILSALSERLWSSGVHPYYLHILDAVQGAQQYAITLERAVALHQQLQARLSGYLVPALVQEIAGQPHKVRLSSGR